MTNSTLTELRIVPLVVPETLEGPDARPFVELAELDNLVCRHEAGHDYFDHLPSEVLPSWQDQTDSTRLGYLAYSGRRLVGAVTITIPTEEGGRTLDFDAFVHPGHWGEGIGDALLDTVERVAAERGRSVAHTWTLHRGDSTGEKLMAPTGFGGIPATDPQTELFLRRGYTFEQTERNSVFDLRGSFEKADRLLAEAREKAGADYRVVTWNLPTPAEYAEGYAYVISRMATDVPSGAMVFDEETWDAARIARRDERLLKGGQTISVAAVQHVPSGRIVAYNELVIGPDHSGPTHQYGTLVLEEHRGHRLGMLVKGENLRRWRDLVPESPRVSTFNAEENRPMLDINEALGFVPASYAGAWKKVMDA
ncbi:GNAT family N-acetyltransferase [Micromonospora sp. DT81.3]|uniref:GNAT family N-acetyltransferase n=1 Tax=Micromonospora sp. DT81.3 TaxID=3416523 RepID=UPI003CE9E1C2